MKIPQDFLIKLYISAVVRSVCSRRTLDKSGSVFERRYRRKFFPFQLRSLPSPLPT